MKRISEQQLRRIIQYKLSENFKRKLLNEVGTNITARDTGSEGNAHAVGMATGLTAGAVGAAIGGWTILPAVLAGYGGYLLAKELGLIGFKINTGDDDIEDFFIGKLEAGLTKEVELDALSNTWNNEGTNDVALAKVKKEFEAIVKIQKCHDTDDSAENWNNDIKMNIINSAGKITAPTEKNSHLLPIVTDAGNPTLKATDILTASNKPDKDSCRAWFDLVNYRIYYRATPNLKSKMEKLLLNAMKKVKKKHWMPGDEDWIDYLEGDINNLAVLNAFSTGTTPVWAQKDRWYSIKMEKADLETTLGKDILKILGIKSAVKDALDGNPDKAMQKIEKCGIDVTPEIQTGLKTTGNQDALKQDVKDNAKSDQKPAEQQTESKEITGFIVPRLNRGYYELAEILVDADRLKQCFPKSNDTILTQLAEKFKKAGLGNVKNVMKAFTAGGENYPKFLKQGETISLGNISKYGNGTFPNIIAANPGLKERIKLDDWLKSRGKKKINNSNVQVQNTKKRPSQDKIKGERIVDELVKNEEQKEKRNKALEDILNKNGFKNNSGRRYSKSGK